MDPEVANLIYKGSPFLPYVSHNGAHYIQDIMNQHRLGLLESLSLVTMGLGAGRSQSLYTQEYKYINYAYGTTYTDLNVYLSAFITPPILILTARCRAMAADFDFDFLYSLAPENKVALEIIQNIEIYLDEAVALVSRKESVIEIARSIYNINALPHQSIPLYHKAGHLASENIFSNYFNLYSLLTETDNPAI